MVGCERLRTPSAFENVTTVFTRANKLYSSFSNAIWFREIPIKINLLKPFVKKVIYSQNGGNNT